MNKNILRSGIALGLLVSSVNTFAVEFGLFGDINFSDNSAPGENSGFSVGALDFYATTYIAEDTQVFVEYVFEDGGNGLVTDLERLWISRNFSDEFTIAVGRFHTPLGVWNRSYHHGALLQDTVSRPFFLDFEDGAAGVLPVHIVGALANGTLTMGSGEMNYEVYVANGSSIDSSVFAAGTKPELDINGSSDSNANKTFGARLTYTFDNFPITVGGMFMDNVIAESGDGTVIGGSGIVQGGSLIDQQIIGLDLNMETDHYLLLAEYYRLKNDSNNTNIGIGDSQSHIGTAYYVQAGYKFDEENRVVFRHASLDFDNSDSYFSILKAQQATHNVIAFRHDLDVTNAIKFEINRNSPETGNGDTTYVLQWAFLVP